MCLAVYSRDAMYVDGEYKPLNMLPWKPEQNWIIWKQISEPVDG